MFKPKEWFLQVLQVVILRSKLENTVKEEKAGCSVRTCEETEA